MRTHSALAFAATAGAGGWYWSTRVTRERLRTQYTSAIQSSGNAGNAVTHREVHSEAWARAESVMCEDGNMIRLWAPPTRNEQTDKLKSQEFDILVIGGGATGSGIALDAARRGLKVALVERQDYASGTSSRSTKLIHGGIRYLMLTFQKKMPDCFSDIFTNLTFNKANYDVVCSDLYERAYMIESAPYMTRPLPMMIPMYKWWEVPVMWMGGKMYDFLAGSRRLVPSSHYISSAEAKYNYPSLKEKDAEDRNLKGCLVIYDGQMNDTRMNITIALTAIQHGAIAANHIGVQSLDTQGSHGQDDYLVTGARVKDFVSGEEFTIKARKVINATGPFSDSIRKMADPNAEEIVVPAQGAHLVLPDYLSPDRMGFVRTTADGRVLYFLPWEGSTIAGTTDHKTDVVDLPTTTEDEIEFILNEANAILSRPVKRSEIRATWAGLRPLVRNPNAKDTKEIAREHIIEVTEGGLITVCGGKWTTYRKMAEDAVDAVLGRDQLLSNKASPCTTLDSQLLGADRGGLLCKGDFQNIVITLREVYDFPKGVARHLVSNYGTRSLVVAQIAQRMETTRKGKEPGEDACNYRKLYSKYPVLEAEVIFACRHEYAINVTDVLARRTRLAFLDADAAAASIPRVASLVCIIIIICVVVT
eukprot:TRINITY_DN5766_c0_g1_i3.p1 TRINITY_DN5766_c0_g1~~TRINITY_DN5766_c0_g1_i3.p1  ORF type:complete len:667 (+),score=129.69 TRINITY_DN5766_c0_g1_i3:64-2001(+)